MSTAAVPSECPNCGAQMSGRFCSACGQDCGNLRLDSRALLREGVAQILGWDGSLLRTMRGLWRSPGELALDYVRGRRKAYLHPARFCLISLALWLVALELANMDVLQQNGIEFSAADSDSSAMVSNIRAILSEHFDWLLFIFLPLRAFFLRLAFRRSGHTVGACLVPVFFVSGFGSLVAVPLVAASALVLEEPSRIGPFIASIWMVWTIRTTHGFFGVGWLEATLKSLLVVGLHVASTVLIVMLVAFAGVYFYG